MNRLYKGLYFGMGILGVLLIFCLESLPDGLLHVYVLNIGQGDAILIQTPANEHVLIDGGPDNRVIEQLSKVMPFYEKDIDMVILTHPHADHVDGLVKVLKRYRVKTVLITALSYYYPGYLAFLTQIEQQHIPTYFAGKSNDFRLGTVIMDMLYPFASLQGQIYLNVNNSSIVFRLIYGTQKFYFAGDLEMEKEAELISRKLDLRANFLKAGHHGSRTSSTEALLDMIQPRYAAISCGINNKFHHPHSITIENLQRRKIKIYRTDLDGMIEAISDGKRIKIKNGSLHV